MKKLLFITFALAASQAFAAYTPSRSISQLEQQEKAETQHEESLLQTLTKLPIFTKLKNQLSQQYPGLFDSLAAGDVSGLLTILENKLQDVVSKSFQNLTPAIENLKPATITIEDLRKLKTALDAYAKGLLGSEESLNPQLKSIFNSAKNAYRDLVKKEDIFSTVVNKDFPIRHKSEEFLKTLFYNIIEGEVKIQIPQIPENEVHMKAQEEPTQGSLLESLKNLFGL